MFKTWLGGGAPQLCLVCIVVVVVNVVVVVVLIVVAFHKGMVVVDKSLSDSH